MEGFAERFGTVNYGVRERERERDDWVCEKLRPQARLPPFIGLSSSP